MTAMISKSCSEIGCGI